MDQERFWVLLSRKLAKEVTPSEDRELDLILERNPELRTRYDSLRLYWEFKGHPGAEDLDNALQKTLTKIKKGSSTGTRPVPDPSVIDIQRGERVGAGWGSWLLRVAVLLLFGLSTYFLYREYQQKPLLASLYLQEKENAKGAQSKITLADGSTVWLNASSKLQFPTEFSGQSREVYLTGEAFFDVAKDSRKPFIIHLKDSRIKVLGTSFNVKAYDEDEVVETSVVTGEVAFIPREDFFSSPSPDPLLLTANVKATYSTKTGKLRKEQTNSHIDKAWTEGKLVFRATRLEEVGKALERAFGKQVKFANQQLKQCRITASFENSSLKEVMYLLSRTRDYRYTISDREVVIDGAGCQSL